MTEQLSTNSTFYLSLATLAFAFLSGSLAYTIKSKCSSVKCCYGALEIIRDIEAEVELEEHMGLPSTIQPLGNTRQNSMTSNHELVDFRKSMTNSI